MSFLSGSTVSRLLSIENGMNESLVVELSRPKRGKKKLSVLISDGEQRFRGFLEVNERSKSVEPRMKKYGRPSLRVRITEHITHFEHNEPSQIEIVGFQFIDELKLEAARPVKLEAEPPRPSLPQPFLPQPFLPQPFLPQPFLPQPFLPQEVVSCARAESPPCKSQDCRQNLLETLIKENRRSNSRRRLKLQDKSDNDNTAAESPAERQDSPQSIRDLYESYYNWTIVVRVVESDYKEFTSKKGKMVKLLTVELIDREGSMISGNHFGEGARGRYSAIKSGKVYRVSRGKVTQDTYSKLKREHESPFTILFTNDTEFLPTDDDPDIPYCRNNWLRLSQIPHAYNPHEFYNFIALLADVQPPKEIPREERTIVLQTLCVGDPVTGVAHQVALWDNKVAVDPSLLGKSVLLKKFKITSFKGEIKLSSTTNSQILRHNFFTEHEGKCSFSLPRGGGSSSAVRTVREVGEELQGAQVNSAVYSCVEAWVKEVGFDKKWFYDACPGCRKSCANNSGSRCEHCRAPIELASKCFRLELKLADLSGSIEVTAFGETAGAFLKQMPIEALFPMTNRELCDYAESHYCYEQYRLQIKSVRDMLAQQRHTIVGKPLPVLVDEAVASNLKRIASLAEELAGFGGGLQ